MENQINKKMGYEMKPGCYGDIQEYVGCRAQKAGRVFGNPEPQSLDSVIVI